MWKSLMERFLKYVDGILECYQDLAKIKPNLVDFNNHLNKINKSINNQSRPLKSVPLLISVSATNITNIPPIHTADANSTLAVNLTIKVAIIEDNAPSRTNNAETGELK